jgi:hypothetical protein
MTGADPATMALGLSGGAIIGLALRGAIVTAQARTLAVAAPLAMLGAMVMLSCGAAWTFFPEYVGHGGWIWLGCGVLVGLVLGESAVRIGARHRRQGSGRVSRSG